MPDPTSEGLPELIRRYQVARADAVLVATPGWDAAPLELFCSDSRFVTFYFDYTPTGVGGDVRFYAEWSPRTIDDAALEDWFGMSILAGGAVVSGADTISIIQHEIIEYGAVAGAQSNFPWGPIELESTAERVRLFCQESGLPGAPGNLHVVAIFS